MKVHHIALVCQSEENADRFYQDILGLERIRSFTVSAELSKGCFGFDQSYQAMTYVRDEMNFEVFVIDKPTVIHPRLHHVGLEVEDLRGFLDKCREMQVEIAEVSKGEGVITMIKDFDGNVFEIKEKA